MLNKHVTEVALFCGDQKMELSALKLGSYSVINEQKSAKQRTVQYGRTVVDKTAHGGYGESFYPDGTRTQGAKTAANSGRSGRSLS